MPKLSPYQRIVRAAKEGKGVHLSGDEVFAMALDDAIETMAYNDDEADANGWERGTNEEMRNAR